MVCVFSRIDVRSAHDIAFDRTTAVIDSALRSSCATVVREFTDMITYLVMSLAQGDIYVNFGSFNKIREATSLLGFGYYNSAGFYCCRLNIVPAPLCRDLKMTRFEFYSMNPRAKCLVKHRLILYFECHLALLFLSQIRFSRVRF